MVRKKSPITVAYGDGIGPEIMEASLSVLLGAGAALEIEKVEIGEKVYLSGNRSGIEDSTWEKLKRTGVFYKAPITTPQGGGFKSLNVTIRAALGLYANVRPCVSYSPYIATKHPKMDVVIIRENEEDLYTGIEYRQTHDAVQALKIITRTGCEKIIRYAFEYALVNKRKKVTCFTKDNILKLSDGLFHKVYDEIAKEYSQIENEHWIIDIGAAKLADTPENFDVIVMPNLYGDILSDVAAQIAGSVGLAGSANIGENFSMFEAIHGSAPRRAGQNVANPSGLLLAGVMMLVHLGQGDIAAAIHNAWLKTIEDGVHTYDIFKEGTSKKQVGTKEFAQAVLERLGKTPQHLPSVSYQGASAQKVTTQRVKSASVSADKKLVGVDIFVDSQEGAKKVQERLSPLNNGTLRLTMISSRGTRVWPDAHENTAGLDQWRCRYQAFAKGGNVSYQEVLKLLGKLAEAGIDVTKTENLYTFGGQPGYTLGQEEQ